MANRVLLDTTGLFVSKPGVDVLTASNDNLLFSSDWTMLSRFTRGSFSVPANTTTHFLFGKTFASPPIVDVAYVMTHPSVPNPVWNGGGEISSFNIGTYTNWFIQLSPTGLYVKNQNAAGSGYVMTGFYDVWDFKT